MHDDLTGLPNRRALVMQLDEVLASSNAEGKHVVLAGIDLDGFKTINDRYGHSVGDKVLVEVAQRIRDTQRGGDYAYRTEGDEFVVVLTGFDPRNAVSKATDISNRLIRELSRPFRVDDVDVKISASVGIAVYPTHGDGPGDLTRLADLALYAAKSQGKGCVVPFERRMDLDARRRGELEADLRGALERKELHLHYQPLVDLDSGRVCGMEALLRWAHPRLGNVPPLDFIPLAEQTGLIDDLGEFVIEEACRFGASLPSLPGSGDIRIAVNVSPIQLQSGRLPGVVRRCIRESGISADRLELELTEQVVISDMAQAREALSELRALGVGIAIDDFGSGQASLNYLSQFPFTKLKIDRSFVRHLGSDLQAAEITKSIVTLGRSLGVRVIAEGVEYPEQIELLRDWQCDEVQGYLLSKPLVPEEMRIMVDIERDRPMPSETATG
ncbi:MAG: EAL domain-containing protein [Pseudomonadota bacterium]